MEPVNGKRVKIKPTTDDTLTFGSFEGTSLGLFENLGGVLLFLIELDKPAYYTDGPMKGTEYKVLPFRQDALEWQN